MKKFVFASVMALATMSLVYVPALRAQDSGTITIKDPIEFKAYQDATGQSDPKALAAALESFLTTYPQSVVKQDVLNRLVDAYQQAGDADHALSAAKRLLQVDPGNMKAIFLSVAVEKNQCQKTSDAQTCDDAAALAKTGLKAAKPAAVADADWKKQTDAAYPIFDSAIATDDVFAKKDFKAAVQDYRTELMLLPPEATTTPGVGMSDTLNLAEAYIKVEPIDAKAAKDAEAADKAVTDPAAKPAADKAAKDAKDKDADDFIEAVWFYSRVWDFAPAGFKPQIEKKLEYWYNKYHGSLDGLDAIKTQAQATEFPPGTLSVAPADTPAEKIHKILATTPDLNTLALADKELVLTFGAKEDADKLWALLKDQPTPVPGTVIDGTASVIKVAVTDDAKQSKVPDFTVNMKEPLTDKDVPAAGADFGLSSKDQAELDGTYDSYTVVKDADGNPSSVQIVLRDGSVVPLKKKAPVHKPTAAHHAAAH